MKLAKSIAYLGNPSNPVFAESEVRESQAAARAHGVRLLIVNASCPSEFEMAFADIVQQGADALVVSSAVSLLTDPDKSSRWRPAMPCQRFTPGAHPWLSVVL
jgi:putative tryptophan/tyrosine transport system substrate-binding protein